MYHNHTFANVDNALPRLLVELDKRGQDVGSRNGRCVELTHVGLTLTHPWQREITIPFRKPNLAAQIAETMWVLAGRDDLGFLSHYLPRALDFSDDGETWRAGYGRRLRQWSRGTAIPPRELFVDQWAECIRLLKADPMTRRAVMSIWDPALDTEESKDIPCNDWLSWSSRLGHLDLMVGVRSNDIIWGWSGINAFEWSALLEVTAGILGLRVGALHFATTSLHLYETHFKKAQDIIARQEAIQDPLYRLKDSPRFSLDIESLQRFDALVDEWFKIEKRIRTKAYDPADWEAVVNTFPEPMLQSWLRVIQWWWTGDLAYLAPLKGTRLEAAAARASVAPPKKDDKVVTNEATRIPSKFMDTVCALHTEKHQAYGDSWKRRGEMLGIMANIARKVDRLGQGETADETSADTAMDLFVYLAKYQTWLYDDILGTKTSDDPGFANEIMMDTEREVWYGGGPLISLSMDEATKEIRDDFNHLEALVTAKTNRTIHVEAMTHNAYRIARTLWEREQAEHLANTYKGADVD